MLNEIRRIISAYSIFRQAFGKHKNKVIVMTLLGFASGLMGGIGIGAVIPLFSFIIKTGSENTDPISKLIAAFFSFIGLNYRLRYLIILIGLLFAFKSIFLFLANLINYRAMVDYEKETRQEIFEHVIKADWPHLLKQKIGHLSTVVLDNISAASALLNNISVAILFITSLITYAIVALNISLYITLLTFAIGSALFIILMPLFKRIRRFSQKGVDVFKDASHFLSQHIIGAKTVKTMAVEK
ncbi:MAG: ABC transporter ATP-binding protein, partial [Candidatus Yanofskybacteria bacterium]|nr:ABC transporter ATP-binding protein [Candidatus Yanofskybacteria bacterium]